MLTDSADCRYCLGMANLTSEQIESKIRAKESFWVQTSGERTIALRTAKTLRTGHTTRADDRGGFYVFTIPKVKK